MTTASTHAVPPAAARVREPWLTRRNPTVLLVLLFAISFLTLFLLDIPRLGALYGMLLLVAIVAARFPLGRLALAQLPFLAFGIGVVLVNAMTRPGTELWPELPVRVTAEGLRIGVALALRTLAIGAGAVTFARVVEPRRLMVSLVQHARLSPRFAYALLAGHRLLGEMPARWRTITRAHAVRQVWDGSSGDAAARRRAPWRRGRRSRAPRGGAGRGGQPRLGARELLRCAFALLVSSIRSSERIAFALESRGLAEGPRTVWRPVALDWRDGLLAGAAVLAAVAIVVGLG